MCQTLAAVLQTIVCILQMIVRIFMTCVLMVENLVRLVLQTIYNLLSFVAQLLSIIPICLVMVVTSKMKFLICGGGGGGGAAGVSKNGTCDCVISTLMVVGVFLVFRETGVLDRLMVKMGYLPIKGLVERMKKDKVVFPKQYTIPPEWNALRTTRVKNVTTTKPVKYDWVTGVVSEETRSATQPTQPAPVPDFAESLPSGHPAALPSNSPESSPPVSQSASSPGYPTVPPPVSQPAPSPDSPPAPTLLSPQGPPQPSSESPPVMPVSSELLNPEHPKNITSNPTPPPAHWTTIYYYIA